MSRCSTRLLVLLFALTWPSAPRAQARPPMLENPFDSATVAAASSRPEAASVYTGPLLAPWRALQGSASEHPPRLAWDCVPSYWWGYWTWAWQPCAWIDRSYVAGTIGAVAALSPANPASERISLSVRARRARAP